MTSEQADWLRKHTAYRAVGVVGGNTRYAQRGVLFPDGVFVLHEDLAKRPARAITHECFEVGILEVIPRPGQS